MWPFKFRVFKQKQWKLFLKNGHLRKEVNQSVYVHLHLTKTNKEGKTKKKKHTQNNDGEIKASNLH